MKFEISTWTHQGFFVRIHHEGNLNEAMAEIERLGLLPEKPGELEGVESEVIGTVMRREKAGDGTPIIDFYPQWQHGGKYGAKKYAHLYLDTPEDVAQFEAQSGLRLADIPVYESATPLNRNPDKPHAKEVNVARSFKMSRRRDGEHDTGMPKYKYLYTSPVVVNVDPAPWHALPGVIDGLFAYWHGEGLTDNEIIGLAEVESKYAGWGKFETPKAASGHINRRLAEQEGQRPPAQPRTQDIKAQKSATYTVSAAEAEAEQRMRDTALPRARKHPALDTPLNPPETRVATYSPEADALYEKYDPSVWGNAWEREDTDKNRYVYLTHGEKNPNPGGSRPLWLLHGRERNGSPARVGVYADQFHALAGFGYAEEMETLRATGKVTFDVPVCGRGVVVNRYGHMNLESETIVPRLDAQLDAPPPPRGSAVAG